ncbi:MAG: DsbA family protein [Gammaproteobacteria bacterium]|nr:DsbA family protein [Gammaproteobacteria bacterium]
MRLFLVHLLLSRRTRVISRRLRETRRRLLRRPHVISVFLQLDDPYSYLLAHYLPGFAAHYDIELRLHLSEALGDEYQPKPEMLAEYAVNDCERLARELGIPFLDKGTSPPVEHRLGMLDAVAACYGKENFDAELLQVLTVFWRGDAEAASRRRGSAETKGAADAVIRDSQQWQIRHGHYNSAMLHYEGEWYWGVDRLPYLLDRLHALGAARQASPDRSLASIRQAMQVTLPVTPPAAAKNLPALEFFHSIRSPYSYLALRRAFDIADAYGLELRLRPVLPMVMRGMQVPTQKLLYILKDAAREAERLGIAFGRFADPVGTATERCLAVFRYAEAEKRGREFLQNAGEAIWSQAVDVASDSGMRTVTGKTGLFWPDVKAAMENDEWRAAIEENRESMMASGCWGVPTMRIGDFAVWGQDRDWLLVRHIEELCDTGDGILV